ncbi:unnamed protein product [Moneuplotes crassus]|uniref:Uncharacterized protein n=1 Tax=Euplotes crassus TaxID=5936 RepID=A0AAD1U6N5_EUPCR|nr:unnamed protein product [Moneuplotes crassus]
MNNSSIFNLNLRKSSCSSKYFLQIKPYHHIKNLSDLGFLTKQIVSPNKSKGSRKKRRTVNVTQRVKSFSPKSPKDQQEKKSSIFSAKNLKLGKGKKSVNLQVDVSQDYLNSAMTADARPMNTNKNMTYSKSFHRKGKSLIQKRITNIENSIDEMEVKFQIDSDKTKMHHTKRFLSPEDGLNFSSSNLLMSETNENMKRTTFSINTEKNTPRRLSLLTPNKANFQKDADWQTQDFLDRNKEVYNVLQEAYASLEVPKSHQKVFDRIFKTFEKNCKDLVKFHGKSETDLEKLLNLNQCKIIQLETRLAEYKKMMSDAARREIISQNKKRMREIDQNLEAFDNLKNIRFSKRKIANQSKVTFELEKLYSISSIGANTVETDRYSKKELQIAGFEVWKNMLKSKGIDIQNMSAQSMIKILQIKGPNAFRSVEVQTDQIELQSEMKILEKNFVNLKAQNEQLQQEKEEDLERIRELQILERTLEERIKDLQMKKISLENNLEEKEVEITKLNYKVNELKDQAELRKEEFETQKKKLSSLAKNLNEIKMERSKWKGKFQKDELDSQSALSISDSDEEPSNKRPSMHPRRRISALQEMKESDLLRGSSITPIDEEDEEDHPNMNKTTTFTNIDKLDISDEESMSESYSETSKFEYERGSKNTSSNLIRSNTKLREYARMSTFRSDSSNNSKKFKFRNKVGRRDVLVQTDKKMFDKFLKHKCNEFLKKRKGRERNKLVQTEEEVSEAEEQRQKELLLQYGHKFSRAGDSSFRGFSSGENNEIVYKNPQRASLQLFPLTIQEESDMFEVTGTPARRESNAKDSFRYPLKSLRKPRESQFKQGSFNCLGSRRQRSFMMMG